MAPLTLAADETPAPAPPAASSRNTGRPGRYKLGPLFLTPKITLTHAGVDTNVNNAERAPVQDTSVGLTPSLDIGLPVGRRLRFTGRTALTVNYFGRTAADRSLDPAGSAGVELDVGPLTLFGSGGVSRQKRRISLELDERLTQTEDTQNAGATVRLTRRLSTRYTHRRQHSSYERGVVFLGNDVKTSLDRRSDIDAVDLRFALTPATTLVTSAERQSDLFLNETSRRDTASSRRYLGGFEFTQLAFLSGNVMLGVREYPPGVAQAVENYDGVSLSVSLDMPFVLRSRLNLRAYRDIEYSAVRNESQTGATRNSYVSSSYAATLQFGLPFDLITRTAFRFEAADYVDQASSPTGNLDFNSIEVSLLRVFWSSLRIGGTFRFAQRHGREGFGYDGLRYGATAEWVP